MTSTSSPRVGILSVKVLTEGSLRAIATVQIGPLVIHGCRLVQQQGQSAWTSAPQSEWTDSEGKKRYRSMLEWPREWGEAITEGISIEMQSHPAGIKNITAATPLGQEVMDRAGIGGCQ